MIRLALVFAVVASLLVAGPAVARPGGPGRRVHQHVHCSAPIDRPVMADFPFCQGAR